MPSLTIPAQYLNQRNASLDNYRRDVANTTTELAHTIKRHREFLHGECPPNDKNVTELREYYGIKSVLIPRYIYNQKQANLAARKMREAGADTYEVSRTIRSLSNNAGTTANDLRCARAYLARANSQLESALSRTFTERMQTQNLNPTAYCYQQAVGIELECFGPPISPSRFPYWSRVGGDSSIDPLRVIGKWRCPNVQAIEVRMLTPRSVLELRLDRICRLLTNHRVNKSCGLHVHFDMRGRDETTVYKIAQRVDRWLGALAELVPESRRMNSYCEAGISKSQRYRRVNFTSYAKHKTLEIRFHSGTVDYTKILAWVRLCELLIAMKTTPRAHTTLAALESLPLADHDLAYWKERHRTLNPNKYTTPDARPADEVE